MVRLMLVVALALSLAACGGGSDGLSRSEERELEALVAAAEAAKAQAEAEKARAELEKAQAEADKAAAEAEVQRQLQEAQRAREAAEQARLAAEAARREAEEARGEAETAQSEAEAAERERQRLAEEANRAQQDKDRADAAVAFNGLSGTEISGALTITPKFRAPAGVVGAGTISQVTGSSAGSWYVTTARSLDGNNIVRIYSDVGAPDSVNIEAEYPVFIIPEGQTYREATITDISGYEDLITSSSFPTRGRATDITLNVDTDTTDTTDKDTARFAGVFAGASGHFVCVATTPGQAGACNVNHDGDTGYTLGGGAWTFQTSRTAKVTVPDTNYMHFGWWRQKGTGTLSYKTVNLSHGSSGPISAVSGVSGIAKYVGPAIGHYAVVQSYPGSPSSHGEFTATVELTANFGATATVYGSVTGFDVNPDWALTLEETAISGGGVTGGEVSWTIDTNTDENTTTEGTWAGQFHNELETFGNQHPEGISGTFHASYENVAKLRGAYGAHLQ